jgi:hypothetical protein
MPPPMMRRPWLRMKPLASLVSMPMSTRLFTRAG